MKRKRFSAEQIIAALREHDAGAKASIWRKYGPRRAGCPRGQAAEGLEDENRKLKKLLAESMLDNRIEGASQKKW